MSANVPELRFSGFADPWEQRKLGELGVTYGGLTGKSKEDFGHGDARFVPYTNVFDNPIADSTRLGEVEIDVSQNRVLHGDTLFTVSSETPNEVGMSSVWLSDLDNLYLNSFCFGYRQDGSFDPYYLAYMLRSQSVRENIELLAQGISRFNISKGKVMEVEVPVPMMAEQRAVGALFSRLDSLIALHQRKHNQLSVLKSLLLERMFPKPGSDVPELRFSGFADPWEQRKLGEFGSVEMCKRIYKEQTSESGEVPFFKIGTFGSEPDAFISNKLYESYRDEYPYPEPGTPLISAAGSIGRTVVYQGERAYYQDSNIVWLDHDDNLDNSFLDVFYSQVDWKLEGSTIKRLYNKDILNAEVCVPSLPEQRAVGALFSRLDSLIALHQRKLEKLRALKQSLLQKMFV
ncbi:hypothetical protein ADJ70_07745 [Olsenella sp. oral taxon 807]|uniref:restriction endonuclease subunit S n=1 Tax=Olsenella sp. oral taxon 807 TaxID=712411 RepID=UPI00067A0774|nr:restriction endonuclease subunit S [Olsenella sp. oral taxon 807]AKT48856.1 hypothetical protein ADJ70_07745 [Olsenella sp. oral taxon 807]